VACSGTQILTYRDEDDARSAYSDFLTPLLWSLIRSDRARPIESPNEWISELLHAQDASLWVASLLRYLENDDRPVDLSWRVIESQIDDGEAHFIDTDSDLVRALILVLALYPEGLAGNAEAIGRVLRLRMTTIENLAADMSKPTSFLGRLNLTTRVPVVVASIEKGVAAYKNAENERLRNTTIDVAIALAIVEQASADASLGFPREWLARSDSLVFVESPTEDVASHEFRLSLPRQMLIDSSASDVGVVGSHAGRLINQFEENMVELRLRTLRRRTWSRQTLTERLDEAVSHLADRGITATDVLLPVQAWWVGEELARSGLIESSRDDRREFIGSGRGMEFRQVLMDDDSSAYVLSMPGSLAITLAGSPASWLTWALREDPTPPSGGAQDEPKVTLALIETVGVAIDRERCLRVAIPLRRS
jgi:hypothetical protein